MNFPKTSLEIILRFAREHGFAVNPVTRHDANGIEVSYWSWWKQERLLFAAHGERIAVTYYRTPIWLIRIKFSRGGTLEDATRFRSLGDFPCNLAVQDQEKLMTAYFDEFLSLKEAAVCGLTCGLLLLSQSLFAVQHASIPLSDAVALDLAKASIIDVRYAGDYRRGHIKGAVSMPYYRLDKLDLPKDRPIVTYCSGIGCALSMDAAAKLKDLGYTDVRYLLGGIAEWELKGYPIVRDETPVKPQGPGIFEGGEVSPPKVNKNLSRLMVLDTRPETEFLSGHVPGARNIPLERLSEGMGEITGEVIVCDRQPARWKRAALLLKEAGYDAHGLSGGIGAWVGAKLPLETGADTK